MLDNEARELAERIFATTGTGSDDQLIYYGLKEKVVELIAAHDNLIRAGVKLAAADLIPHVFRTDTGECITVDCVRCRILALTTSDEQAALDALVDEKVTKTIDEIRIHIGLLMPLNDDEEHYQRSVRAVIDGLAANRARVKGGK